MALRSGTRLGPYEIEAPLGAGGMGEVYRARDTRLDRTVAVKMLPARVSKDPRLQRRFEREARALAGLSHPRICTLHDVGNEDGVQFLVMELLEGETLAERLERGALPLDQVLEAGIGIADALDAAHRRGVVHRDVKPGNVMLMRSGVKLLDFGLARDTAVVAASTPTEMSATATRHAAITAEGTIVGTLHYMAPEQLEGREADARSDLFSLGVMLYEMLTGTRPFKGNSKAGLIAAVLTGEPAPIVARRAEVPASLSRVVHRCLAKDPDDRWQSARDVMLELAWIANAGALDDSPEPTVKRGRVREWIAWGLALASLVAVLALLVDRPQSVVQEPNVSRLSVALPDGAKRPFGSLSPDGRTLAISLSYEGQHQIWLRPLDSLSSRPVPGTENGLYPFWSRDGRYIGFFAAGKLKKVDARGGPPQVLCNAPGPFSLGSWSSDGTIVFNVLEAPGHQGVYRVSDAGGTPTKLTIRDESDHEIEGAWPEFLPDDRHFLLFGRTIDGEKPGEPSLFAVALETGRASVLLSLISERGSRAMYAAPGYLVYTRDGALVAQVFDPDKRVVAGEPVTIVEQVEGFGPLGLDNFSVAGDVLSYQSESTHAELLWKDRNGRTVGRVGSPGAYADVALAPDGRKLATSMYDLRTGQADIWIFDLERDVPTRFTSPVEDDMVALWSPDGRRIVFASARAAPPFLHIKDVAGGDAEALLPSHGTLQSPDDWSPDGRYLLYSDRNPDTGWDLWLLPLDGQADPIPFLRTPFSEFSASISPDGTWVAYASDESGRPEVYVTTFPEPGEKHRISTDGGYLPEWRGDSNELFYLALDNRLMAVPVGWDAGFEPKTPTPLFSVEPYKNAFLPYDVRPDGERFIVISALPGEATTPTVVTGWQEAVSR